MMYFISLLKSPGLYLWGCAAVLALLVWFTASVPLQLFRDAGLVLIGSYISVYVYRLRAGEGDRRILLTALADSLFAVVFAGMFYVPLFWIATFIVLFTAPWIGLSEDQRDRYLVLVAAFVAIPGGYQFWKLAWGRYHFSQSEAKKEADGK